jgi:hypothetical protein
MTVLPLLVALAASPVSLQFDGPLNQALKQIATKGNLNVVVPGGLDEPVQVNLSDVSAEEALESIARVYGLSATKEGKLWILRRVAPKPAAATAEPPQPPEPAQPPEAAEAADAAEQARQAAEAIRDQAEAARERAQEEAEAARERAQELRDKAQALAEARRDQAQALREMAKANAELQKNRVSAGGPVRVDKDTTVENAVAYGGPVIVEENATVEGDVVAFGGDVVLEANAVVNGDAVSFGGSVVRGPNSVVRGETVSMGGAGLGTAISRGLVKPHRGERLGDEGSDASGKGNRVALFLAEFGLLFGLGFLLKMFVPQRMRAIEDTIRAEPVRNGVAGMLGLLAALPLGLAVALTCVGIPVVALTVLAIPAGWTAVASLVGGLVPIGRWRKTQALALGLGLLLLLLVWTLVPVVSWLMLAVVTFISVGAILRTRFGQPPRGTPIFERDPSVAAAS